MPKAHHLSDPLPSSSSSWPTSRPRPYTTTTTARAPPSIPAALLHHDPSSLSPPGVPVMSVAWAVSMSLAAAQRPRPPPPPAHLDGVAIVSPTSSVVRPRLLGASPAMAAPTTAASRANLRSQLLAVVSDVLDLVDVDDIDDVEGHHGNSSLFTTRTMSSSTETRDIDDEKQSLDPSGHSESHPPKQ